jgi:heme exporter protein C
MGLLVELGSPQTTVAMLMTIYAAYYMLYRALAAQERPPAIAAAYLVFAALVMPLFVFVLPRVQQGLHPEPLVNAGARVEMSADLRLVLLLNVLTHTALYLVFFSAMVRLRVLEWRRGYGD